MVPDQFDRMNHDWTHYLATRIYHQLLIVSSNCPLLIIWIMGWERDTSITILLQQYFCRLTESNSQRSDDAYNEFLIIVLYIDFAVDIDVRFSWDFHASKSV